MSGKIITIHSPRLTITTFQEHHLCEEYTGWLNNTQLMQFSEQRHRQHTLATCQAYLDSFTDTDNYFFAIEDISGTLLGTMTVYQDRQNRLADMGILIGASQARGKGYGHEAWAAVSEWTVATLKPRKLTAGCMASNKAMRRIMESSGMQLDCIRKKHYLRDGMEEDIIYMARFFSNNNSA